MPEPEQMQATIGQWLLARARFHEHGRDHLKAYCAAESRLLEAFAADWPAAEPKMFATAFQEFRAALVKTAGLRLLNGKQRGGVQHG